MSDKIRDTQIAFKGSNSLFWNKWVFENNGKKKRELLINIMNLPEGNEISMRHEKPSIKKGTIFKVKLHKGESVSRVILLQMDPKPHHITLKTTIRNGMVVVKLPNIEWSVSLFLELKKGK